ncbi:G-protein coupled receptor 4-like [Amia ocellicauda]|uniref:G-protein coupled receptor 4-like n=1 Tax=Amia ocellicauda TaxID=2972642 RepID=UPI0034639FAB
MIMMEVNLTTHNNSWNPCDINLYSDSYILCVVYGLVFCIGLPSNCLALYGLYSLVKAENILPVFVINLLLSDLIQIFIIPLWIDYYRNGHKWRFGVISCRVFGCIFYICLFVSIFFMCCIAMERYLAIAHPLKFRSYEKLRNATLICVTLWVVVSIGTSAAFCIGLADAPRSLCMETYSIGKDYAVFQLVAMTITFLFPFVLLMYIYYNTRKKITSIISVHEKEKRKIMNLLSLIIVIFVVVFGPYHIICYVISIAVLILDDRCNFLSQIFIYEQVTMGLLSLNCLLDPVMYIFLRKDFRKTVVRIFPFLKRARCWKSLTGSQVESTSREVQTQK